MKQEEVSPIASSRRTFLKGAGMTGIGLASAAFIGAKLGASEQKVEAATYSDTDIGNFALNLEYLEAEFYAKATYGATLVQLGVLTTADETGPTTGGSMVPNFKNLPEAFLASALRMDEIKHVMYLRSLLGSAAVKKPAINLDALGYGFSDVYSWLKLAMIFEDVGVSAYLGAAPLLTGANIIAAAAAILGTEAQHAGAIRAVCIMHDVDSAPIDSLDVPPTSQMPFDVDMNALSIPRTPSEILNLAYGGGQCSGGFFPNGMNGTIVCM